MDCHDDNDGDENEHEACYILHRGAPRLSPTKSKSSPTKKLAGSFEREGVLDSIHLPPLKVGEPAIYGQLRLQAFRTVWGRVQKIVEDIMEDQSLHIYEEIQHWICNRQYGDAQLDLQFATAHSENAAGSPLGPTGCTAIRKQLQSALLFLGSIDPSDHGRTFDGLAGHLRMRNCHVARLTSMDFLTKGVVGLPLRALLRQLIGFNPETTDMDVMRAWHCDAENHGRPVVVVIENAESCESKVLAELVHILSDWILEIPMILIMGMATTDEAIRKLLPANVLVRLRLWKFTLKLPTVLLEVVMRAVLVDFFCAFELSQDVVAFLYGYFHDQDLTVTGVCRALKMACVEHFWNEPLSFLCESVLKANSKKELEGDCAELPEVFINYAAGFPSLASSNSEQLAGPRLGNHMAQSLWDWKAQKKTWAMAFLCLQAVGKHAGLGFFELLCEALAGSFTANSIKSSEKSAVGSTQGDQLVLEAGCKRKDQVMSKLRDMPIPVLKSVLEEWRKATIHEQQLYADICRLLEDLDDGVTEKAVPCSPDTEALRAAANQDFTIRVMNRSKLRRMGQAAAAAQKSGVQAIRSRAEELFLRIITPFLLPQKLQPFSEIFCFRDVHKLEGGLIGDTRTQVHLDLLRAPEVLNCKCCRKNGVLSSSLHDTCLAYGLSREHGDLIRVQNWFSSFVNICDPNPPRPPDPRVDQCDAGDNDEPRRKRGRTPKNKNLGSSPSVPIENVAMEARFARAASELQIVGLIQLPKNGQSDTVRRICI